MKMVTSCIFLIFLGCICLYNASEKAILFNRFALEGWLQSNRKIAKIMGALFVIIGLFVALSIFGTTSGILLWIFLVSTILSLMIVLTPIKKMSYYPIIIFMILSLIFEIIF